MSDHSATQLIVQQEGGVVQVTMNRPEALNALNFDMIRNFTANLSVWEEDDSVRAVFISGAGSRAFCAGGDIKSTYKTILSYQKGEIDERALSLFFFEEYSLNRQLFHFKKPLFAFMNGITMGGGFGVAGPCRYRIAAENTIFAMPEVLIGFFPDVGSLYFLNRCPGETGAYLALTGNKITAEDMLFCGLATHYIPVEHQGFCQDRLRKTSDIESILADFHTPLDRKGDVQKNIKIIDECFKGDDVISIIDSLRTEGSVWAVQQADIIEMRSPVSLKVSLAHLRKARNMDFDAITAQDFILAQHFMQGHDFSEGVRALLIDKDHQAQWKPKNLGGVTLEAVEGYFSATGLVLPSSSL